jgi:hypothetical protein
MVDMMPVLMRARYWYRLHLPVGYHGRASSVVVSGTPVTMTHHHHHHHYHHHASAVYLMYQ